MICGFLCPFGLIQELFYKIPLPKVKKNKVTHILSYLKYIILIVFVIYIPLFMAFKSGFPLPAFCKYICPLGAIYSFFNRISLYRYSVDESKCTHCGVCKSVCRMGVDMSTTPNSPECIRCGDCKAACPHHAICAGFGKKAASTQTLTADPGESC